MFFANFPVLAFGQIGGPESRGPTRSIRHSSEIRFGQDSRVEQKEQRRKPEFESTKRCDKRCAVREVNHIVDIMKTIFYIARIRAGWLGLGGEGVRSSAPRRGHRATSEHVFWLPGVNAAKGSRVTHFLRGDQEGLRVLGLWARLAWRTGTRV